MTTSERVRRLENVLASVCELIFDDAINRDISWQVRFDPLRNFIKEYEAEATAEETHEG